jgi:Zn-dependent peptidase ImmA (M78 family)
MVNQEFKAPYLPPSEILKVADQFLSRYHPDRNPPIPIEEIVEFQLRLGIDPTPNFKNYTGIVSALSSDLKTIYIDENLVNPKFFNHRYRYSLAHEVGHVFLHGEVFKSFQLRNIYDWKKFMMEVDMNEYSWLESHAYQFAGLILVPKDILARELKIIQISYEKDGQAPNRENEIFEEYVMNRLIEKFQVSSAVIVKRMKKDGLSLLS